MTEHHTTPPLQRVDVREFRANLSGFLRRARRGATFVVTSRDVVLAELRPPPREPPSPRRPGALRGRIRLAPDFETWLPDVLDDRESGVDRGQRAPGLHPRGWNT